MPAYTYANLALLVGDSADVWTMSSACPTFLSAPGRDFQRGYLLGMQLRPLILYGRMVCLRGAGT